jgi:hypothetical protein
MTGMDMYIGHNGHSGLTAFLPDGPEPTSVELDDTVSKAVRVDVIVKEELLDPPRLPLCAAEKEGAALPLPSGAAPELIDAPVPET